jgi:WD40 repeat protein
MRILACCLVLSCAALTPAAAPPARDPDLPPGARLRLGKPRWMLPFSQYAQVKPLLSPDRQRIATGSGQDIEVFEVRTARRLSRIKVADNVMFPVAFSHDNTTLAVSRVDATQKRVIVQLFPVRGARTRTLYVGPAGERFTYPVAAAFLPGDKRLATYDAEALVVWDLSTNKRLRTDRLRAPPEAASFSPDGRLFAAQVGASLVLTDLVNGGWKSIALPMPADKKAFAAWSFSPDGRLLALTTESGRVLIHDTASGKLVRRLTDEAKVLAATAFSPDGRALAVQGRDALLVFDARRGTLLRSLKTLAEQLAYRDEHHLLAVSDEGHATFWDVRTGKRADLGQGHSLDATGLAFTADGRTLVSVGRDDQLIRWDVKTGQTNGRMMIPVSKDQNRERVLSVSANGQAAVVTGQNVEGEVTLIDLKRLRAGWQEQKWPLPNKSRGLGLGGGFGSLGVLGKSDAACVISPNAALVAMPAMTLEGPTYRVEVRRANGKRLRTFDGCPEVKQAFSADSRQLALSAKDDKGSVVRLFDLRSGVLRQTLTAGKAMPDALACSADGRVVATQTGTLYVWEAASGLALLRRALPDGFVPAQIVVTPAGRILVVGMQPHALTRELQALVWDVGKSASVLTVPSAQRPVALCGRGRTLAVGWTDGCVLLFDVPAAKPAKPVTLTDATQVRLWDDLASGDATRAWKARTRLVSAGDDAVALLSKRLKPAPARTIKAVAELDDEDFDVRLEATKKLAEALKRGDHTVELALAELIENPPSLEVSLRAQKLLASNKSVPYTAEELRVIRAVGVLAQIGSGEATALLERLEEGGPSLLTAEARAAVARSPK